MSSDRYRLIGNNGSPYSNKLRAIMRYRRLPHDWVLRTPQVYEEIAHVRPQLVPVLRFPEDGSYHVDSTPLVYSLEARHPDRSILPPDPGHAFLAHLIEDMADEWGTKMMFHYRWYYDADARFAAHWLVDEGRPDLTGAEYERAVAEISERQRGRMPLVGCTEQNRPVIEASYQDLLDILQDHVGGTRYLFGSRPSLADFGLYGQLRMLAEDPTPQAIMRDRAHRVDSWVRVLDDASGIEGEWLEAGAEPPRVVRHLLELAARDYLPFLAANAEAYEAGRESVELQLRGWTYSQGTFRYQVKCYRELRERFAALEGEARQRVEALLGETGCLEWFAG